MTRAPFLGILLLAACHAEGFDVPPDFGPDAGFDLVERDGARLRLGQALFFDRELSGNRNIACATCHVPFLTTAEPLPLTIGEGGEGVGPTRRRGAGEVLLRNTTDLFNRDEPESAALFWDGRVERLDDGSFVAPIPLPDDLRTLLEVQALLPIVDRDEMRGHPGDVAADGRPNELAALEAETEVFDAVMARLLALPDYAELFALAFPGEEPRITHVARAIADFERVLWTARESPFDRMLAGEAWPDELEEGWQVFQSAGCVRCHAGPLLSDQRYHAIASPMLGPRMAEQPSGLDEGRAAVTGQASDRFAFRTPSLRNVALTPPYIHSGAYATLEAAVRHHLDPAEALRTYDPAQLPEGLRGTLRNDPDTQALLIAELDDPRPPRALSEREFASLLTFLREALTEPIERTKHPTHGVPTQVPSGLPVDAWPGGPHPHR